MSCVLLTIIRYPWSSSAPPRINALSGVWACSGVLGRRSDRQVVDWGAITWSHLPPPLPSSRELQSDRSGKSWVFPANTSHDEFQPLNPVYREISFS